LGLVYGVLLTHLFVSSVKMQCWNYKQVNGRAAMASDSEPRKLF